MARDPFTFTDSKHRKPFDSAQVETASFAKIHPPRRFVTIVSLPHPSGRCRAWNNGEAIDRARALLRRVAPDWYGE